jgi:hypothetical protein
MQIKFHFPTPITHLPPSLQAFKSLLALRDLAGANSCAILESKESNMRSLLAQLSPREENTLRRIASGFPVGTELPATHMTRLVELSLIQIEGGRISLTELGARRHAQLDRPEKWSASSPSTCCS